MMDGEVFEVRKRGMGLMQKQDFELR